MADQFRSEPENIVVLYYFSLTCLLVKKYHHCLEALRLVKVLCQLNYQSKRAILLDYYRTKAENIETLVRSLIPQASAF